MNTGQDPHWSSRRMPWSRAEVEATVADYFEMLDRELRDEPYSKAEHRRRLSRRLVARSDGAIERKHQNISAVLIESGFAYIPGYRPLGNYQGLLVECVLDRLSESQHLKDVIASQVTAPAGAPTVDDILATLVAPPRAIGSAPRYRDAAVRDRPRIRKDVDYLAIEASNRSLGSAGEEFVLRYEIARLLSKRCDRLAARVEHVSRTRGDGLGFDILSFDDTGEERLIEVKTTNYGDSTPFFVTRNELAVSRSHPDRYHVYRAFNFRKAPRLYFKRGSIDESFLLEPSIFEASIA